MNLFFDLETKDYTNRERKPKDLRMSVAVVMDENSGIWIFDETQAVDLIRLLMDARRVIGFNIIYFDYGVLSRYPLGWSVKRLSTVDIFREIKEKTGQWPTLGMVAEETVRREKTPGIDPVGSYRSGKLDKVIEYCKNDVDITRRIYFHGRDTGKIWFRDRSGAKQCIDVNWS